MSKVHTVLLAVTRFDFYEEDVIGLAAEDEVEEIVALLNSSGQAKTDDGWSYTHRPAKMLTVEGVKEKVNKKGRLSRKSLGSGSGLENRRST